MNKPHQTSDATQVSAEQTTSDSSPTAQLKHDVALKAFLSKEVKNNSAVFKDYPPTRALVRAAILDVVDTLGIK